MLIFFADDTKFKSPSREGMGPLIGIGGFYVDAEKLNSLEEKLDVLCLKTGFPRDHVEGEFKWSPHKKKHWMRDNLIEDERQEFRLNVLDIAKKHGVEIRVIIEDGSYKPAIPGTDDHDMSVTKLFMERVQRTLERESDHGLVIVDRPSGDRKSEDAFLSQCIETIQNGTDYVTPDSIALNVLSSPSKYLRCLQLADLIVGCSVSYIAGEYTHSPPLFERIKTMLCKQGDCVGGVGVKIHPDYRYVNLYHWLLGDKKWGKFQNAFGCSVPHSLPIQDKPYPSSPTVERDAPPNP